MILEVHAGIPATLSRRVGDILEQEEVSSLLPEAPEYRLCLEAVLEPGSTLAAAHAGWNAGYLTTLPGLGHLARQPAGAVTPPGIVRVSCECIQARSGGMSSHYGFVGYFVSLLVSVPEGCVWDARVEAAA
jgi:hypothetical protein